MSLTEVSTYDVVKKQFMLKFKAFSKVFTALIIAQIIAMLFSAGSSSSSGGSFGSGHQLFQFYYVTGDIVFTFTLIWAVAIPYGLVKREQRTIDFTFVSNRITNHLSNFVFLTVMSLVGALMAFGSSLLLRTLQYLFHTNVYVQSSLTFVEVLTIISVMFLYILLLAIIGYTMALLMNLHAVMKVVVPVTVLGFAIFTAVSPIYFLESSLFLLFVKVLFTVLALLGAILMFSDRWEVR
ncbi:hypothetical protein [Alkalibacillus haloalkaliphilus]|uniref:Uncharacterized protein n=1 Tax=Alkalibacillus haloalkaliphilus TaxID=94136 RepID=A0A511W7L5_9BACI|nr:hypothetical protein [Alkalibacillus haloalkaliphilus]GEN46318.1 hypothetical protein AHA02nite_20940 [Alkalibacillus haloalkaliphilus]